MPITRDYILSFKGDTLQDLRDGLAQAVKEKYEEIKTAADASGESVNGYIKKAIDERMERDQA